MAPLSEDEENYIRLALVLRRVTPIAVRTYFDREFSPTSLPSTLSGNHATLVDLKVKRIINQAQWNLLYPRNGLPDSQRFDVTLMICLIRNLTAIRSPINGFDCLPLPGETTPGSDLARIKCYRNKLAHPDSNAIDCAYFNTAWGDLSDAVCRLGGPTMYQECQELKVKMLDQSNPEIKQALEELRLTTENLGKELSKVTEILRDPIPPNIKEQIKKQIEDWKKKDKMYVSTRASDYVMKCLQNNSCVTLTAPSGVGKSYISRHTALVLQKAGYKIIPVYSPTDIRDYYQPGVQTVFIVDDICGNFIVNLQQIENWKQLLPVINTIIADKCCKIIVSCRLQVYKDEQFNILLPFKSCECNLISDKLGLTSVEKTIIANTYLGTSMKHIDVSSCNLDFFPLLCSLCHEKKSEDVEALFKKPFDFYKSQLDNLSGHGDEGKYTICSLALCVLFYNKLEENWFQDKVVDTQRSIIEDTCNACGICRSTSKVKLRKALDTLDGTFIGKSNGIYITLHGKLLDFLVHYFGQKMIECVINHGDSELVRERFIWQTSPNNKTSNIEFIIRIPDVYLESYIQRLIKDWSAGNVTDVLCNNNLKVSSFRQKLLDYLKQLDKSNQETLANAKQTVKSKETWDLGNTPLILTCFLRYTDMIGWMLLNNVDVNQCRDSGATGLIMASQRGHTDIVKLLLEWNANINLCNSTGRSPLFMASEKGHTDTVKLLLERNASVDLCNHNSVTPLCTASQNGHSSVVKLLLERNPNVDLCNKDGCSPLFLACQNGHTDIVKLLLENNSKVDIYNKYGYTPLVKSCTGNHISIVQLLMKHKPEVNAQAIDGGNALYFSAHNGNTEITRLLLDNNADCNIYIHSKQSITNTFTNHPNISLDKEKQILFDCLVKSTPSLVTEYVSKKSVEYAFDVVAGSSPLHIACFMGRTDVARCLIDYNANINMAKEDGTTPLFYACEVGHEDIVHVLLNKGADTQICRLDGKSPVDIAIDNGHTSIVFILTEHKKRADQLSV